MRIAAVWLAIALVGGAAGTWNYRARHAEMRANLLDDARRSAVAVDAADVARLSGTRDDLGTPTYAALKRRLQQLQTVDPQVRFVYLLRVRRDTGDVIHLADSAGPEASGVAGPGAAAAAAAPSPGLRAIVRTGRAVTEGPRTDGVGTWMTGYAAIEDASAGAADRESRDILGLEVEAEGWQRALWEAGFQGAFYVWILLGLPLTAWVVMRRQHAQNEVIRNLSEAMEQSHSAIMIVDLESRIEYANRGLCQQIGYSRRELIGRKWRDFHVPHTAEALLSDLVATVRAGRSWEGEWFNQRKDGTVYPVHGIVTPVRQRDGSLSCFVAVFDDVTETRRREAELREARDLAQAGDRAKGQFLATMSHEVRTPLNGIVGFTSLLLDTPLTPEQREYVQTIRMSTEALIQLTGDILDFARIESGKLTLDPLACDPRECVEDALDLLAAKAAEKKIELLHRVGRDVPAAVVTDGGRLRQILVNLVGNAVKFTDRGEVEVSVELARETPAVGNAPAASDPAVPEPCVLVFTVRDTGIGIASEHHAKLFRPFSQVDESTTRRYGGTGLGLAICHNLVELMGGTIGVTSEPGRGATFTFTIHATLAAPLPPERNLGGLKLGLAIRPGALRRQLADLVRSWHGEVVEADEAARLDPAACDLALFEVCEDIAREIAAQPDPLAGFTPEKSLGLVPISLSNDLRTELRVHFRLLVNKPVHHEAFFALLAGSRPGPSATPPTHFGFRVLVVEDNPVNWRFIQRALTNLGCTSSLAENGRQALELLAQRAAEFDLVLMDLHMPEMDGIAALREIRSGRAGLRAQTMWIVALTADAREQQRTRGMAEGLNDYLTKPLKLPALEAALKKFRAERMARKR